MSVCLSVRLSVCM